MDTYPSFVAEQLRHTQVPAALALAEAAGAQGVYIRNVLHAHPRLGPEADMLALARMSRAGDPQAGDPRADALLGLIYFGPRGNLLVLQRTPLDPELVAKAILGHRSNWRIVLAPPDLVDEITRRGNVSILVNREQAYYSVDRASLVEELAAGDVRLAERKDLDALMHAALHLNQSDLRVDPWCVDRDWLKRSTKSRIRSRLTYVIGPVGHPVVKLDLGSQGPAGVVIEGVYTWPTHRGRGLAPALLTAVALDHLVEAPLVCLHVAGDNTAARHAYEKCGMRFAGTCRLMLRQ